MTRTSFGELSTRAVTSLSALILASSKQDDAYLITDLTSTLYEQEGPSTIVLVAGDADYVLPMLKSLDKGWRNEVAFINRGASGALELVTHEFRILHPSVIRHAPRGYIGANPPDF